MGLCPEEHLAGVNSRFLKTFSHVVTAPVEPIDSPLEGPTRDVRRI